MTDWDWNFLLFVRWCREMSFAVNDANTVITITWLFIINITRSHVREFIRTSTARTATHSSNRIHSNEPQWIFDDGWNSGTSQFVVLRCGSIVARSKQFERTVPLETGKETERPNSIALNYTQNKLWLFELTTPRRGNNGILWIVESAHCRHHWQTMCLNFGGKLRSLDDVNGSRKWITKNTNENSWTHPMCETQTMLRWRRR